MNRTPSCLSLRRSSVSLAGAFLNLPQRAGGADRISSLNPRRQRAPWRTPCCGETLQNYGRYQSLFSNHIYGNSPLGGDRPTRQRHDSDSGGFSPELCTADPPAICPAFRQLGHNDLVNRAHCDCLSLHWTLAFPFCPVVSLGQLDRLHFGTSITVTCHLSACPSRSQPHKRLTLSLGATWAHPAPVKCLGEAPAIYGWALGSGRRSPCGTGVEVVRAPCLYPLHFTTTRSRDRKSVV